MSCWDGKLGKEQNKPNWVKTIVMRKITPRMTDQTHREYPLMIQWLGIAQRPEFEEKQMDRGSLRRTLIWVKLYWDGKLDEN